MDVFLLLLRLALGAVFLVAAITKLTDRAGTRKAIEEFGAPAWYARPASIGLPIAELAVTGCLLVPAAVRHGAFDALILLGVFSTAIGLNLARGRQPDCHCFGQLHSEPIGWRTLARNGVLAVGAVLILALGWSDPGPSAVAWIGDLEGAELLALVLGAVALVAIALGAWVSLQLLRQHGRLMLRIEKLERAAASGGWDWDDEDDEDELPAVGIPVGRAAPGFVVPAIAGGTSGLTALLEAGRPALLVFTDPGCGPCQALMPDVATWQAEHADELTIALLSSGERDEIRAKAEEHALVRVLVDPERSVSEAYQAHGTPAAVLVAPDGTIASPVAQGSTAIQTLLRRALAWRPAEEPGIPVGEAAPALTLLDLEGGEVPLAERLDAERDTLLVFWNPGCGFCRSMHEDLVAYEAAAADGAPRLLVLSTGEPEAVRAEGFAGILRDPDFAAAGAFGAGGTPMGVLVGPDGKVASRLAAGATAVLDLTRSVAV